MDALQISRHGNILYVPDSVWLAFAQSRTKTVVKNEDVAQRMARLKAEREAELQRQRIELEGYLAGA